MNDLTIERAARGDRDAMASIVGEHYPDVYRFCVRRLGPDAAEDAAQETFVTAWKSLKRFRGESSLRTWLIGIALNSCRSIARKRKIDMSIDTSWLEEQGTPSPEASLVQAQALREALGKLSREHREVVVLHEFEELTYEEAASVLGVPVGTVKSRLYHAFVGLRRALDPLGDRGDAR